MSGTYNIPFFGVDRQYANLREEILDVSDRVYSTGMVLDGPHTQFFNQSIAKMTERKYAISVNSGTQALVFALRSLDGCSPIVYPSDKILIPSQSFVATVNAVYEAGFTPVFCDVDSRTGLMDLNKIPVEVNEIRALMYVNLFGNVIDYDKLTVYREIWAENNVPIIEDAAQSLGAYYRGHPSGKLGDISCLSFDPTKNLNNYGSGGMILTDDYATWEYCEGLRNNGKHLGHDFYGTNARMSEADCAQMLVKLKYFDEWQERRAHIAEYYIGELMEYVDVIQPGIGVESAWHKFVIRLSERHALKHHLAIKGIETRYHYDKPLFELPVGWDFVDYAKDPYRGAVSFSRECLSLPIYPEMTDSEVTYVIESILEFLR